MRFLWIIVLGACEMPSAEFAEGKARAYAADNYPGYEVVNAKCETIDSDSDKMVRCNLAVRNPTTTEITTPAIECPYIPPGGCNSSLHEMCEAPKGVE